MVAAAVVVALAMVPVTVVVVEITAAVTSVAVRARRTPASLVKILATARQHQVNRVRRKPHAIAKIPNRRATAKIPNRHVTATSNSTRTHAVHAPSQEASRAMTSTTSNPPATPPRASRRPASRQAATAATSAADAPAAVRVAVVAGATGLVGRAVLARLLAAKSCAAVQADGARAQAFMACSSRITCIDSYFLIAIRFSAGRFATLRGYAGENPAIAPATLPGRSSALISDVDCSGCSCRSRPLENSWQPASANAAPGISRCRKLAPNTPPSAAIAQASVRPPHCGVGSWRCCFTSRQFLRRIMSVYL